MADAFKLKLSGVSSGYGAVDVVNSVSLAIRPGEIFTLMGKNGMGKTTLLKTILGFLRAGKGKIEVDGAAIIDRKPAELIASGIGYAPQELPLFQDLSIRDNLRLALKGDRDLASALERVYAYFPFLRDRLAQKAGTLSGGEQKMLILARALMLRPKLLLIDEISEGLQPSVVQNIAKALRDDREKRGTTILLVEQNLDFALSVADRWAILKLGAIEDESLNGPESRARVLQHLKI
ncbi:MULTISPECIES: ABC transporter ATP-binding protein [unclassified Rhizobium]|uniref:ABC transporter ATP-binding protein n=1 Tax=unclassified Rhizobium TaxID=2613769 RepID=UPI00160FAC8B|nr:MULTISPECIES: ABC transporter ATP-binding protein [unclassified Rhizobium]MBB3298346.1 branched-chain amino acid transport system ATP-binding protein [Rhizobium sp. BK112]MBB3367746.1 branched-chain amino acid transport system ATP-binding protein [Rhizobium sp. BK077]MBB4178238.1 branched-chain amino acid transport system ATP-binding protein [Rhizobium sp. BK109]